MSDAVGTSEARPLLDVAGLCVRYGLHRVLEGISLRVAPGEVVALLGRNGAGKSTTLKAIMGLVPAASGRVTYDGGSLLGRPPYETCRLGVGYVPQDRRIFPDLSVRENLEVGMQARRGAAPVWTPERIGRLFPALASLAGRRGGSLSGGEQQMLTIARTLMGNPRLLLLDEPSEGLAPLVVQEMAGHIQQLKAEGMAILLSEQNLHFTTRVCDRAYILEKGQIRYAGTLAALLAEETIRRRHLMV